MHAGRDGRADARRLPRGRLRSPPAIESRCPNVRARSGRSGAAEVADAEADQQVGERPLLRRLDRREQVGDRDLAEALELRAGLPCAGCRCRRRRATRPALAEAANTVRSPRPSMSIAPRDGEVHDPLAALGGAVDVDAERVALALGRTSGLCSGHGHVVGNFHGFEPFGRSASTGSTTSGITSPALRTMTVSPGRTSFACTWSSLCSVARPTVEPPTNTGSSIGERRRLPGAADRHHDVARASSCVPRAGTCRRSPSAAPCDVEAELARAARGRRPSRPRRRSRRRGRGGAPASCSQNSYTSSSVSSVRISGFTGRPSVAQRRRASRWWLVNVGPALDRAELVAPDRQLAAAR